MARRPTTAANRQTASRRAPASPERPAFARARKLPPLPPLPWDAIVVGIYILFAAIFSFTAWRLGGYAVETDAFSSFFPETARLMRGDFTPLDGFKGPGYHLALALVGFITRDLFVAAKFIALASAAAVALVLFRLVRKHLGAAVAWLVLLLVVTNAQFVLFTIQVGTDMYFLALAIVTARLLLDRDWLARRSPAWAAIPGLVAGLAYLTRYTGLFLIAGGIAILALADRTAVPGQRRLARAGAFAGAAVLAILPWSLFTASEGKGLFYNLNYLNIAYELYGRDRVHWDAFWEFLRPAFTSTGDVLRGHVGDFLLMSVRNAFAHLWLDWRSVLVAGESKWPGIAAGLWGALVLGGLAAAILRNRWRAWPAVLLGLLTYGVLVPVFHGERLSLPMLPIYATLAAIAVVRVAAWPKLPILARLAPATIIVALAITGFQVTGRSVELLMENSPNELRPIIRGARGKVAPGGRILARKPHVAWFLGQEFVRIPIVNGVEELPGVALQESAKYLLVSVVEVGVRPPLEPLLDPRNAPPFLRVIASTAPGAQYPAVLYEFAFDIPPRQAKAKSEVAADAERMPIDVRIGRGYLNAGEIDLAREYFERALAKNPNEANAHLGLAFVGISARRQQARDESLPAEVREEARRALVGEAGKVGEVARRFPNSADAQLAWGEILVEMQRFPEAVDVYKRVVLLMPDNPQPLLMLGDLQVHLKDLAGAEASYRAILRVEPRNAEGHRLVGTVLLMGGRAREALPFLAEAVRLNGSSAAARLAFGTASAAIGDTSRAIAEWRAIVRNTPPNDDTHREAAARLAGFGLR